MERRCGREDEPLSQTALTALQTQILRPRATRYVVRRSPPFVGLIYIPPMSDGYGRICPPECIACVVATIHAAFAQP